MLACDGSSWVGERSRTPGIGSEFGVSLPEVTGLWFARHAKGAKTSRLDSSKAISSGNPTRFRIIYAHGGQDAQEY